MTDQVNGNEEEFELKSKTQIKQEMADLKDLGIKLVDIGQALDKIPMSDELREAILLARRINRKKEGFRRQLQFIGKLMRNAELEPIEQAISLIENRHQQANAHFHKLEKLRDSLLADGDSAIQELIVQYPDADRQQLRNWVRQAQKQQQQNKPPKAAREIFQYLKSLVEGSE